MSKAQQEAHSQRQAARENSRAVRLVLPELWQGPSTPSGPFDYVSQPILLFALLLGVFLRVLVGDNVE